MLFWDFMIARERIRLARLAGRPRALWTNDRIFTEYSFTNVKRIHDRTTTIFNREFYKDCGESHPSPIALLNATAFRYFGRYETVRRIGWLNGWDEERKAALISLCNHLSAAGLKIFTGAYIIPSCGDTREKHYTVADIMDGVWNSADDVLNNNSWEMMTDRLKWNWGVGSFMAKEVLLDYMLATKWRPNDWSTWTPVGPGARRGATYVEHGYLRPAMNEHESLEVIQELYAERDECWLEGMVDLDLTDIQFQLCEYAKYIRFATGGTRPKRKFRPTEDDITRSA